MGRQDATERERHTHIHINTHRVPEYEYFVHSLTSLTLETATTEALKKAKNDGIAKMPSQRLPSVKTTMMRMSRMFVTPAAMLSADFLLSSISWPAACPLNSGMAGSALALRAVSPLLLFVVSKNKPFQNVKYFEVRSIR